MPMVISYINGEIIGSQGDIVAQAQEGIAKVNDVLFSDDEDEDE